MSKHHDFPEIHRWQSSANVNIDGVTWGGTLAREAAGHVPNYEDVFYRGCISLMPAAEFLGLAKEIDEFDKQSLRYQLESIENHRAMAPPFLRIAPGEDGQWEINGHEGRHRAMAVYLSNPDALIPVAIWPGGAESASHLRARHLNAKVFEEWTSGIGMVPENPNTPIGPIGIHAIYHEGTGMWLGPALNSTLRPELPESYSEMLDDLENGYFQAPSSLRPSQEEDNSLGMPGC